MTRLPGGPAYPRENQVSTRRITASRGRFLRFLSTPLTACMLLVFGVAGARAQDVPAPGSCDWSDVPGVVWWGSERYLPLERFASYAAPVFWHSPDEPEMEGRSGVDLMVPEAFPFEEASSPVVYYQMKEIQTLPGGGVSAYSEDPVDRDLSLIDMEFAGLVGLEYYAYYSDEAGLGAHKHDIEPVDFKLGIIRSDGEWARNHGITDRCSERHYVIVVTRVTGKAHGIEWFWNIIAVDEDTNFPMYIFVEEGKHALATDKNSDGYFTPSYDVNVRVNDAWGVKDIIRSGGLFAGGYQPWMTKVRQPEHRVFPPLPDDSPLLPDGLERQPWYEDGNAVYDLRELPRGEEFQAWDETQVDEPDFHALYPFVKNKEVPDWPVVEELSDVEAVNQVNDWLNEGTAKKSLSVAAYADGSSVGFSWVFPLFVVKNMTIPMTGGYLLHRMYLKGDDLGDFGWMLLYANSASRWIDSYLSAGVEWHSVTDDLGVSSNRTDFVLETGLKFRAQIGSTPIKFLSFFTDFWGVRAGIKNYGFFDIDRLTYVLEVGAGSF